jgi:hypothetical protein
MASTTRPTTRPAAASLTPARAGARHGHIVSQAPGRIRVRLHRAHRDPAELAQIERGLTQQDGIAAVATNPRTGSVLVQYDRHALSKDEVVSMLYDVGVVAREVLGAEDVPPELGREVAPHSATATGLLDALTDLDNRVSRLTGGRFDVKLLVPAGLGLIALRQIMTTGLGLAEVPGYVLIWYTFDSFYKLHQRRTLSAVKAAVETGAAEPTASTPATNDALRS